MICTKVTKPKKDATDLYHLLHPFYHSSTAVSVKSRYRKTYGTYTKSLKGIPRAI